MDIDHVHFYVDDAIAWRDWFMHRFGLRPRSGLPPTMPQSTPHTQTVVLQDGAICFVLSSPVTRDSPVANYLNHHPAGVVDVAFRVPSLEPIVERAIAHEVAILQPIQAHPQNRSVRWTQMQGWGALTHTLIESPSPSALYPTPPIYAEIAALERRNRDLSRTTPSPQQPLCSLTSDLGWLGIDHAVLNVAAGELQPAIAWYEAVLGFQRQQAFAIHTRHSGLCSQVLVHPNGTAQLPINEPTSPQSQIQEFLDSNRGSGIQHIALQTQDIVQAIAQLRQRGLAFLSVPPSYYEQLSERPGFQLTQAQCRAIAAQEVLVDWQPNNPNAMLLQAFTQPIFGQPTFFFELIQRQHYYVGQQCKTAEGFGEGNFRALFEAIEREQQKRGSLK